MGLFGVQLFYLLFLNKPNIKYHSPDKISNNCGGDKMKKLSLILMLISIICMLLSGIVSAEVYTTGSAKGYEGCIHIIGTRSGFPMEYYNEDTKDFEGVLPDLLREISQKSNIAFAYINGGDNEEAKDENSDAELISVITTETSVLNSENFIKLLSYETSEGVKYVGFSFTDNAQEGFIEKFEHAASQISQVKIDGLIIKHSDSREIVSAVPRVLVGIVLALLTVVVLFLFVKFNKAKREGREAQTTDEETGLGNLAYFKHRFEDTIDNFSRSLFYVAYIILDNNYLRSYHGDKMFSDCLKYTADTLSEYTSETEFAARISESGFSLVFVGVNEEMAQRKLEEIMKKLNDYVQVSEKDQKLVFHAALYNLQKFDTDSEMVLFNIRKNCNRIIGTDKQIVLCSVHSMNKIQEEKRIAESIQKGLEDEEFKLYLQFIIDAKTGKAVSAEALSRWEHREKGLLFPGEYIQIMERSGLISRFDIYMFERVVRQLAKWKDTEFSHLAISCNFTRITISEEGFIPKIKEILKKYDIDRTKIRIEITEDAIEKNIENALTNIAECKKLGFSIALDDLGSGYTSLVNLCDYPIDVVKIDRSILLKADNERGKALFEGIVELSHKLGLKVTCEGVETEEQDAFVKKTGCDYIQGFLYCKPMSEEEYSFGLEEK